MHHQGSESSISMLQDQMLARLRAIGPEFATLTARFLSQLPIVELDAYVGLDGSRFAAARSSATRHQQAAIRGALDDVDSPGPGCAINR